MITQVPEQLKFMCSLIACPKIRPGIAVDLGERQTLSLPHSSFVHFPLPLALC